MLTGKKINPPYIKVLGRDTNEFLSLTLLNEGHASSC
jgi:hypothetical protein